MAVTASRLSCFELSTHVPISFRAQAIADWYGTLCTLVGVPPVDLVQGLPPVDSNDFWPSILEPNANASGRDELFLSCARLRPDL